MNPPAPECCPWTRRRWILTIGFALVVQLALIFLFSERKLTSPKTRRADIPRPEFKLVSRPLTSTQMARYFFASDPTLFSSASLHSFSGPAWLQVQFSEYRFPSPERPTNWLALDQQRLGLAPDYVSAPPKVLPATDIVSPALEPLYSYLVATPPSTQSILRIEGCLDHRVIERPSTPPPWPHAGVVKNSEIEIGVDSTGMVVSARILKPAAADLLEADRLPEADREALSLARKIRFTPVHGQKLDWGRLVIQWGTIPPPENPNQVAPVAKTL